MGLNKLKKRNFNEVNKFVETNDGPAVRVLLSGSDIDLTIGSLGVDVSAFRDSSGDVQDALVDDSFHQYTHITNTVGSILGETDSPILVSQDVGSTYFYEGTNTEIIAEIDGLSNVINVSLTGTGVAGSYLAVAVTQN